LGPLLFLCQLDDSEYFGTMVETTGATRGPGKDIKPVVMNISVGLAFYWETK
jgi:hypothetical protein